MSWNNVRSLVKAGGLDKKNFDKKNLEIIVDDANSTAIINLAIASQVLVGL